MDCSQQGYQSSSYLTDRVPELNFVDMPFLFSGNAQARAAMDGALGGFLARRIQERVNYRILGYFENGFRHISNRLRRVRTPADIKGMRIRVLPSDVQKSTFELLGAIPMRMDLTEAIEMIKAGTIDAQENRFANSCPTYGVHKFHHFHTVTNHFYVSRPIFVHRQTFDAWPEDLREAMRKAVTGAVAMQREFAIEEDKAARQAILGQGCEILDLSEDEHATFAAAVQRLLVEGRETYGQKMFDLLPLRGAGTISCALPDASSFLWSKATAVFCRDVAIARAPVCEKFCYRWFCPT